MIRKSIASLRYALLVLIGLCAAPAALAAPSLDLAAKHAIVLDFKTGAVLLEKNADERIPPASMSKLMTIAMVFRALEQGRLDLDDTAAVSQNAYRREGSTMFLNLTDKPTIEDLIRGVVIQSGNDACVVLAEEIAGSEDAFAKRMTKRGEDIGLTRSTFRNATGLPAPDHRMSVRDLATLATHLIKDYPDYYHYFSETGFSWAGVTQPNRNPLIYQEIGGDGLKTGHTEEAGYGLVGSAEQDGRRVVVVLAGLDSDAARRSEARRAINWAFREFRHLTIGEKGDRIGRAKVWMGETGDAPLALAEDLIVAAPWADDEKATAEIVYQGPVQAPIEAGQEIGVLRVTMPGQSPIETPLVAAEAVAEGGYFTRLVTGASLLVDGLLSGKKDEAQ